MHAGFAKDIIKVIRREQEQRESLLSNLLPEVADDQWLFRDAPFIAELCLMMLVAAWHQVERELIQLAARAEKSGEIEPDHYRRRLRDLLKLKSSPRWNEMERLLNLRSCDRHEQMKALQLLANSYKHDTSKEPSTALLELLRLDKSVQYASLPESGDLQQALAVFLGLAASATYCDIAEKFAEIAQCFLIDVQSKAQLSRVKWGPISLSPEDVAH